MNKLIALLLLAVVSYAQNPNTAAFPTTVATDATLAPAKRTSQSTLSSSINNSVTSITVASGAAFLQYSIISIDSEEMQITAIASNTLTVTRGFNSTSAASHTAGTNVYGIVSSYHNNQIAAEIKAVQARLRDMTPSCLDAGSNDTYACSPTPSLGSYSTGQRVQFKANTANTGAATVNFNSIGAITIKKPVGGITTDLDTDDIRAGQWLTVIYDGTNFQMVSPLGNSGTSLGSLTGCIGASSGTPSARTLVAGSGMAITNTTCGGNPSFSVDTAVIESRAIQQSGATKRCASSTGSDTYTCTMTPTLTAYTDGMVVEFEATATANTGAASLNVDSVGAINIKKCDGSTDPANSDIAIGRQIALRYDGTVFRLPCNPVTISTGAGDAAAAEVQSDSYKRCEAANASTTYTCTMTPTLTTYSDGMIVHFRQTGNSSPVASSTLNIDGLGAKAIKWTNGTIGDTALGTSAGTCVPWQDAEHPLMYVSSIDAFVMTGCISFGAGNLGTAASKTEIPLGTHDTCSLAGSTPNYTCTMGAVSTGGISQGTRIAIYSSSALTSAFTINVNSNGALSVKQPDGTSDPSASCPVPALTPVLAVLNADGTDTWRMVSCAAALGAHDAASITDLKVTSTTSTATIAAGKYSIGTSLQTYAGGSVSTTSLAVSGATNTAPILLTVADFSATSLSEGDTVVVSGVGGNTAANGTWTVEFDTFPTVLRLLTSNGTASGAYTLGGTVAGTGSGTVVLYGTDSNYVAAEIGASSAIIMTKTGNVVMNQVTTPSVQAGKVPIATLSVSGGALSTTVQDDRRFLTARGIAQGQGILVSDAGGTATVAVDSTVARRDGTNDYTGANNFGVATRTAPHRRGNGSPAGSNCTQGDSYFQNDASAGSNTWGCTTTGTPGTWTLQGGAGGGGFTTLPFYNTGAASPAASTTYYIGWLPPSGSGWLTSGDNSYIEAAKFVVPKSGNITTAAISAQWAGGNAASNHAVAYSVCINGSSGAVGTCTSLGNSDWSTSYSTKNNYTGLSIAVSAGDKLLIRIVTPAWTTNPTAVVITGVLVVE